MRQARVNSGHEMSGRIMSDDFDGLDATEKPTAPWAFDVAEASSM
jgi:hypothetical protein